MHFLVFYFMAIGCIIFPFYDFTAKWLFYDFYTFYNIDASVQEQSHLPDVSHNEHFGFGHGRYVSGNCANRAI